MNSINTGSKLIYQLLQRRKMCNPRRGVQHIPHPQRISSIEKNPRIRGLRNPHHRVIKHTTSGGISSCHLQKRCTRRRPISLTKIEMSVKIQHSHSSATPPRRLNPPYVATPRRLMAATEHHHQTMRFHKVSYPLTQRGLARLQILTHNRDSAAIKQRHLRMHRHGR